MRSNISTQLAKAGLFTLASLQASVNAAVSADDLAAYPEFAAAMTTAGDDLDWRSYQVTTASGYVLTLWRITGSNDVPRLAPKGPVVLEHGIFSDGLSWMNRTDEETAAFPVKLYELGYDVWICNDRGTGPSRGHTTLDYVADPQLYWDFTFEDIGKQDVTAITDFIIQERKGDTCSKLSFVSHSTGITQTAVAALNDPMVGTKTDRVVALAPCFFFNLQ